MFRGGVGGVYEIWPAMLDSTPFEVETGYPLTQNYYSRKIILK